METSRFTSIPSHHDGRITPISAAAHVAASVCRNASAPAVSTSVKPAGTVPSRASDTSLRLENRAARPKTVRYSRRSPAERVAPSPPTSRVGSARLCSKYRTFSLAGRSQSCAAASRRAARGLPVWCGSRSVQRRRPCYVGSQAVAFVDAGGGAKPSTGNVPKSARKSGPARPYASDAPDDGDSSEAAQGAGVASTIAAEAKQIRAIDFGNRTRYWSGSSSEARFPLRQ